MNEKQTAFNELRALLHTSNAWAMLSEHFKTLQIVAENSHLAEVVATEIQAAKNSIYERNKGSSVAVIPVYGVITQKVRWIGSSTEEISANIRNAIADSSVKAIVLDVNSPGGTVSGVEEVALEIAEARNSKPVIAVVNTLAASAAYWIASQASEIWVSPSGEAGSIGVYMIHADYSEALKKEGIAINMIHAGRYKIEGNPYEPLSEEARGQMQSEVDGFYEMFVGAVSRGRSVSSTTVKSDFGEGRMFQAFDAVKAGLADKVGTLSEALRELLSVNVRGGGFHVSRLKREIEILELD